MLPVAATAEVAEFAAAPLIDAFTRKQPRVEATLQVEDAGASCDLLADHVVDVALGPAAAARPAARDRVGAVPALPARSSWRRPATGWRGGARWRRPRWPASAGWSARRAPAPGSRRGRRSWTAGRSRPTTSSAFPSFAAAAHAAAAGRGVMLAVAHTVMDDLRRGTLVRLDVRGTPIEEMWHCSTLAADRRSPAASALRRFVVDARGGAGRAGAGGRRAGGAVPPAGARDALARLAEPDGKASPGAPGAARGPGGRVTVGWDGPVRRHAQRRPHEGPRARPGSGGVVLDAPGRRDLAELPASAGRAGRAACPPRRSSTRADPPQQVAEPGDEPARARSTARIRSG